MQRYIQLSFRKRGLPHVHIILFLEDDCKLRTAEDVDKVISAEIPDESEDSVLDKLAGNYMMHGPCGSFNTNTPCMSDDDKCKKYFPKKFFDKTVLDENEYPRTFKKRKIPLDN